MELEFSPQISEKFSKYEIPWKFFQWEPSSISTDRLTDIKLIVAFRNFVNEPQNNDKNGIALTNAVLLHHVITNCNI
jgi:hypothetical protein